MPELCISIQLRRRKFMLAAGHTGIAMGYIITETINDWNMMP
jgi:hypothetical protein